MKKDCLNDCVEIFGLVDMDVTKIIMEPVKERSSDAENVKRFMFYNTNNHFLSTNVHQPNVGMQDEMQYAKEHVERTSDVNLFDHTELSSEAYMKQDTLR